MAMPYGQKIGTRQFIEGYTPPTHQGKWLPKNVNEVRCKLTISAHESHLFGLGLRNEQPIKRIMVMQRKLPQDIDMVQFHGEDLEIISRLLSLNHLFKWDVQLQTINLMLDLDFPGADDTEISAEAKVFW